MRLSFLKPSPTLVANFLEQEASVPYTYTPLHGTTLPDPIEGYNNDAQRVVVGHGWEDFQKAKAALQSWAHFPFGWTAILPANTPIVPGQTLAMYFRLFGFWWRNGCRIAYVVDEPRRFAFAYGTLPSHIECGEEVFGVIIDESDKVWYEIKAFSKPRAWFVRLGYPLARLLQEKFRQDSALAVERFVQGDDTESFSADRVKNLRESAETSAPSAGNITKSTRTATFTPNQWFLQFGGLLCTALVLWPNQILGHDYGKIPLLFAFWVLVPFAASAVPNLGFVVQLGRWVAPAALSASVALGMEAGFWAGLLATPWLLFCLALGWLGRKADWTTAIGCLYLIVGGSWFWADRAGLNPLGFDDAIVRLTALHFHYAGFALPLLCGLMVRTKTGNLGFWAAIGTVTAVPLTALGITATHWHWGPLIETTAAVLMGISGVLVGLWLLREAVWPMSMLGSAPQQVNNLGISRIAMGTAGLAFLTAMGLALGYGLRVYFPNWALSIDYMRALHGSLNGLVALPLSLWAFWWQGAQGERLNAPPPA